MDRGELVLRTVFEAKAHATKPSLTRRRLTFAGLVRGSAVDAYLHRNGEQGKGKKRTLLDAPQRLGAITAPAKRPNGLADFRRRISLEMSAGCGSVERHHFLPSASRNVSPFYGTLVTSEIACRG